MLLEVVDNTFEKHYKINCKTKVLAVGKHGTQADINLMANSSIGSRITADGRIRNGNSSHLTPITCGVDETTPQEILLVERVPGISKKIIEAVMIPQKNY